MSVTIVSLDQKTNKATIICESTDTKPTRYSGGSVCIELDTKTPFIFDGSNWR